MNKKLLLSLVDKVIRIDRGGPESRIGKVLAVEDDHITMLTEIDGVVYYATQHIKSITDNTEKGLPFNLEIPEDFKFKKAKSFVKVLKDLRSQVVKINRGGPETLEGVLEDANNDFVTVVSKEEVVHLSTFHIRNISYGVKIEKPEAEESKAAEENSKENKNNSKEENNPQKDKGNSKEQKDSKENKNNSKEENNSQKDKGNSKEQKDSKENKNNSKEENNPQKDKGNSKEQKDSKENKSNSKEENNSQKDKGNSKEQKDSNEK